MTDSKHETKTNASHHTPGPWETDGAGIYGCKENHDESIMLASVYADGGLDLGEEGANARLIAAAPKLLDALESLVRWAELHGLTTAELITGGRAEVPVIWIARAALSEAKGLAV